jgi:hypothetical protein
MPTKDEIIEIAELIIKITNRFVNYPVPSWDEFKILLEKEIPHDTPDPDENVFGGADLSTPTMPYLFLTEAVQEYGGKRPIEIEELLKNADDTKLVDLRFKFNLANCACETIFGEWKKGGVDGKW